MRKHVVVIEDDHSSLEIITTNLEDAGYVVTGLQSFPSIKELAFLRPDCFIINEWLPQVSGHAICLMLKAKPQTKNIPVILVSGADGMEEPIANRCEADLILQKPYQRYNLVQVISLMIKRAVSVHH